MRDLGDPISSFYTDYQLVTSSIKGLCKWKFAVVQNEMVGESRAIRIKFHCAEDCPSDDSVRVTWMETRFSSEGQEIFQRTQSVYDIAWGYWRNPEAHFFVDYSELAEKPYQKTVPISIKFYTSDPEAFALKVKTDNARLKFSDTCMKSMLSNEKLVTLQFKDGSLSTYPSFLKKNSVVLKEFLEMKDANEEKAISDFMTFPKQVGAMMLEVFCYERVMTEMKDHNQYVSTLVKLYELGHQFQMDSVLVASISAVVNMKPQLSRVELLEFAELLNTKKSSVGDEFLSRGLQISIDLDAFKQLHNEWNEK